MQRHWIAVIVVCICMSSLLVQAAPTCDDTVRNDCGYSGINQTGCENKGCCWEPVNPNPSNLPWCFYKTSPPPSYTIASLNQTSYGFLASLEIQGDPTTPYGNAISPLLLNVTFETEDRVHIKIIDPNNKRWEVPDRILPQPGGNDPTNLNYVVSYQSNPFSIQVKRVADGQIIFDSSVGSFIYTNQYLELNTYISSNSPNIYGLGEHREPLRLNTDNHMYTMWGRDTPTPVDQNAYGSHPFFLEVRSGGAAHGAFLRNSNGMDVILNPGKLTYRVIGGVFDFFVYTGPTPNQVIQQYHATIGYPHMPPYWALGWHQCRYGYPNIYWVEQVVANYSAAQIPLDTIWNDIDHMQAYEDFTFDPNNYPVAEVRKFVDQLHANGQRYVVIVDPGIHNVAGYAPYDQGKQANIFIKQNDGQTDFVGSVWPGSTVFPDFLNPAALPYWGLQVANFLNQVPIDGLWIDMNEISNFNDGQPTSSNPVNNPPYAINNWGNRLSLNHKTLAMDCVHYGGVLEYDVHNMYGMTEAIATKAALENYYNTRSFVLARSTFSGSGSYTAHWTGDNFATFDSMTSSITQILAFNMFGVPLVGADICGFLGDTNEELCGRWTALGSFYPFARNHKDIHSAPQEPYLWASVTAIAKKTLAARYSLLPYYYTLFYEAHQNGGTVARPLLFEFPADATTYAIGQQFMIGPALMISPVLTQGATSLSMYFPSAKWYSFWTHTLQPANGNQTLPTAVDEIQVHVRGGYILPMQVPSLTTNATRKNPFELLVALDASGSANGFLYTDDGLDLNVGSNSLQVSFTLLQQKLSSSIVYNNYNPVPHVHKVTILGVALSSVSTVEVSVGEQPLESVPFTFNAGNAELVVNNLNLDLSQVITLVYS